MLISSIRPSRCRLATARKKLSLFSRASARSCRAVWPSGILSQRQDELFDVFAFPLFHFRRLAVFSVAFFFGLCILNAAKGCFPFCGSLVSLGIDGQAFVDVEGPK